MSDGQYCVVCFGKYTLGYGLPVACCFGCGAVVCYGGYRYYRMRLQRRINTVSHQPVKKADDLKHSMLKKFQDSVKNLPESSRPRPHTTSSSRPVTARSSRSIQNMCPICFEDYDTDPAGIHMGVVKSCEHNFHFECLWDWLERDSTCPLCRNTANLTDTDILSTSLKEVRKRKRCKDTAAESGASPNSPNTNGNSGRTINQSECDVASITSSDTEFEYTEASATSARVPDVHISVHTARSRSRNDGPISGHSNQRRQGIEPIFVPLHEPQSQEMEHRS